MEARAVGGHVTHMRTLLPLRMLTGYAHLLMQLRITYARSEGQASAEIQLGKTK